MFNSESNRHRRKRTSGKQGCGKQKESATTNVNMAIPAGTALKQLPLALMLLLIVLVAKAATINTEICTFNNVTINSGSEWKDPTDPCKSYTCMGGILTETRIKCYAKCNITDLRKPRPGECCPRCEGCELNGQTVPETGALIGSTVDACLAGKCTGNHLTLQKKACPVLPCPLSEQEHDPKECCPHCKDTKDIATHQSERCHFNDAFDTKRSQYMSDYCTKCNCINDTTVCKRATCPLVDCLPTYQYFDSCCTRCPFYLFGSECNANDVTYDNNEVWNYGNCLVCRCENGKIDCSKYCPDIKCTSNQEAIYFPGECCPKCILKTGKCTVFGNSHFITFDGSFHNYNFQGSCKYLIASDNSQSSFSIRLVNGNQHVDTSSSVKYIALDILDKKVKLRHNMRVMVNGNQVPFPYFEGPITKIALTLAETVMLTTDFGLKVEWDGDNYLQITVPPSFKGSLSGLCGNYNGLTHDDLIDGNGVTQKNVSDFATFWKLDKKELCFERMKQPQCTKMEQDNKLCSRLFNSEIFKKCRYRLETDKYIDFCEHDCEYNCDMCHCNTLTAYARECERLNAISPDWQSSVNCLRNTID